MSGGAIRLQKARSAMTSTTVGPSTSTGPKANSDIRTISRDHLKQMIDRKADFTLIEVLDSQKFGEFHLPGAINIPLDEQFEKAVATAVTDKSRKVVVYCGEQSCDASTRAAERLATLGYTQVQEFEAGKKGWQEGAAVQAVRPNVVAPVASKI
jgi:rhodanese-related sulfurtransferase